MKRDGVPSPGDRSFPDLYEDAAGDLRGLATKRLGNREDAEDVVQETFLRFYREQQKTRIENPRGYIFRVGWRLIIDAARTRNRASAIAEVAKVETQQSDEITPEQRAQGREELKDAVELINGMPPQARKVFILHRVRGMSHEAIAKELGISRNTVRNHMVRALVDLGGQRFTFAEEDDG